MLTLPFKPFTTQEVARITGVLPSRLDHWIATRLQWKQGDDGLSFGLDYMGTFAVFVGQRYLEEGAPPERANCVVSYVASMDITVVETAIAKGETFPVPREMMSERALPPFMFGTMIRPPKGRLGNLLNLKALLREFKDRLAQAFPNG